MTSEERAALKAWAERWAESGAMQAQKVLLLLAENEELREAGVSKDRVIAECGNVLLEALAWIKRMKEYFDALSGKVLPECAAGAIAEPGSP